MKLTINNNLKVEMLEDKSILIGLKNNILGYEIEFTEQEQEMLEDYFNNGKRINIDEGMIVDITYLLPQFIQHQIQYH